MKPHLKNPTEEQCCLTKVVSKGTGLSMGVKVVIAGQLQPHARIILSSGNSPMHLTQLPVNINDAIIRKTI